MILAAKSSWLGDVDWGTVPDWLAAVGTIGAFAWGFILFLNERTERRQAHARKVIVSTQIYKALDDDAEVECHIRILNLGSEPVQDVAVVGKDSTATEDQYFIHGGLFRHPNQKKYEGIMPNQIHEERFSLKDEKDFDSVLVGFLDGQGLSWYKNARTGRLVSTRKGNKMMDRADS